jgi:DNA-binding MurR/RpiR family transcriptional regulator
MPLVTANLERIGGGGRGFYIYDALADTIATVTTSGYFNDIARQMRNRDVIIVIANNGGSIDTIFVTSATGAAVVTTSAVEGVTAT